MFLVTDGSLFTLSAWLIGPGAWVAHWPGVGLVEMWSGSHFRACDGSLVGHRLMPKDQYLYSSQSLFVRTFFLNC